MSEIIAIGMTAALVSVITIGGPAMRRKSHKKYHYYQ